ncbi:MAG: hypothetical protein HC831_12240 [Chloroflexia bacterium]|nr:hypothetical protein [Chloroflexia bacterium]
MNKIVVCILSLLILVFVDIRAFSQQSVTLINYYDIEKKNIKEKYEAKILNGDTIKEGTYTFYYKNGNPYQTGKYLNNRLSGKWYIFYEDSTKKVR